MSSIDYSAHILNLRAEYMRQKKEQLRVVVQNAALKKVITPDVVEAYAAVHLTDETGNPIVAARHHKLWLEFICNLDIPRLLILSPYGSAKTVWAIKAYVGCYVGFFPERTTTIVCNSSSTADKRSMGLRSGVLSHEFRTTFPDLKPDPALPFVQNQWSLMRSGKPIANRIDPTLMAFGVDGGIIGSRSDLTVCDDILDRGNSNTAHLRQQIEQTMSSTVLSRLKRKTGRVIMIGTSWKVDDYYDAAKRAGGWVVVHTPLLSDTDEFWATATYPDGYQARTLGTPIGEAF